MRTSTLKKLTIHFTPLALAFWLLPLALTSCKKDKACDHPSLPCQTHEGKNTFGCMIDGSPFVASVKFTVGGPVALSGNFDKQTKLLTIQADRETSDSHYEIIVFQVYVTNGIGDYSMYVLIDDFEGYYETSWQKCEYFHDINNKGNVNITFLDETKNIISGTFSMTLINPDCTKSTMVITDGRFDFGY